MLIDLSLPPGVTLVRSTPEFTAATVPSALLANHRVAVDVWGLLRVIEGVVEFHLEPDGESRVLRSGDEQVIEPGRAHRVAPSQDVRFLVEFYRSEISAGTHHPRNTEVEP